MNKMNIRSFALLLTVMLVLSFFPTQAAASTASGECGDNATWSYASGTLTISGSGRMYDYSIVANDPPSLEYL